MITLVPTYIIQKSTVAYPLVHHLLAEVIRVLLNDTFCSKLSSSFHEPFKWASTAVYLLTFLFSDTRNWKTPKKEWR